MTCSPLAAAKFWGEQPPKASRARPKRKQSNPSPTARATIYMRDAFPARIAIIGRILFAKWPQMMGKIK